MSSLQRTAVLIKPDALQRGLVGEIMHRFERKGLKLIGIKMVNFSDETVDQWYGHLKERPFFPSIKNFITSAPIVAMVWEGVEVIDAVRKIVGITKSRAAEAGSIRGDFGMSGQNNLIHASDTVENASREIEILFSENELFNYDSNGLKMVYSQDELV
jgi:nucleoside-diphosphate kinase